MGILGIILLVLFVIICILVVAIVLVQNDESGGLGGLLGGGNSTAFGSRSQTVVTKTTYVLVTLFFLTSIGLALLNKSPTVSSLQKAAEQVEGVDKTTDTDWLDDEIKVPETGTEIKNIQDGK